MKFRRKAFWFVNFSVLGFFSLYALGGMTGFGATKAYADTLNNGNFFSQGQNFVVVHGNGSNSSPGTSMSSNGEEICSLTPTQEAQLDAFFKVQLTNITVKSGQTVQLAIVSGRHLTKNELMSFLKASNQSLDCHLVGEAHLFFLPVLPQIS